MGCERIRLSALVGSALLASVYAGTSMAQEVAPIYAADQAKQPASWVDQVKQPTDWFKWGADFRLRHEYLNNQFSLNQDAPGHEWNFERYRVRVWDTISPCKEFDFNMRLTWEGRHWWEPDTKEEWDWSDVVFDNLNGKFKFPDAGTTVTIGRQDIILGDGWLVLEGTPGDGSRTIYFDAARAQIALKDIQTTVDAIFVYQFSSPDEWLSPINSQHMPFPIEQDETGIILWGANKSIKNTEIDPFFIYKHDNRVLANGDDSDLYTPGARIIHNFSPNWVADAEGAFQFGTRENLAEFGPGSRDVLAGAFKGTVTYLFNDQWKNQLHLTYEYLSGDDPDSKQVEQFDPLWGRWPQWSELLVYTYATETRIAETTNLHRINFGWQANPNNQMEVAANYHLLFADQAQNKPGFGDGSFRGQLFTAIMRYKFNRFFSGHIIGEYFVPGDFFSDERNDPAAYLRGELVFTF